MCVHTFLNENPLQRYYFFLIYANFSAKNLSKLSTIRFPLMILRQQQLQLPLELQHQLLQQLTQLLR